MNDISLKDSCITCILFIALKILYAELSLIYDYIFEIELIGMNN